MLLPEVSGEVGLSIAQGLEQDEDWLNTQAANLKKVNPVIAEFIIKWADFCESDMTVEEMSFHTAMCGVLVYKLLESQAEANWMKDMISLG